MAKKTKPLPPPQQPITDDQQDRLDDIIKGKNAHEADAAIKAEIAGLSKELARKWDMDYHIDPETVLDAHRQGIITDNEARVFFDFDPDLTEKPRLTCCRKSPANPKQSASRSIRVGC